MPGFVSASYVFDRDLVYAKMWPGRKVEFEHQCGIIGHPYFRSTDSLWHQRTSLGRLRGFWLWIAGIIAEMLRERDRKFRGSGNVSRVYTNLALNEKMAFSGGCDSCFEIDACYLKRTDLDQSGFRQWVHFRITEKVAGFPAFLLLMLSRSALLLWSSIFDW